MNPDQYPHQMPESGASQDIIDAPLTDEATRERYRQLFQRGRTWLCVGVVLMGLSFAINLMLFHSETSFSTVMYVMTSFGAACMVKGLADIMGF